MKNNLLLFLVLLYCTKAYSCTCPGTAENSNMEMTIEWYNDHEFVFTAYVDSVQTKNSFTQLVYLSSKTVYKGNVPEKLSIIPPYFGTSCGFDFSDKVGQTYLFYGYTDGYGKISSHFCDGTKRLYSSKEIDAMKITDIEKMRWKQELKLLEKLSSQPNGLFEFKYSNGVVQSKGTLKNGLPDGAWTYYNYYGEKIAEGVYVEGKKTGEWIEYEYTSETTVDGQKTKVKLIAAGFFKGVYNNGMKQGEWFKYDQNNQHAHSDHYHLGEKIETNIGAK